MRLFTLMLVAIAHFALLTGCADTTSSTGTGTPAQNHAQTKAAANQTKVEAATRY